MKRTLQFVWKWSNRALVAAMVFAAGKSAVTVVQAQPYPYLQGVCAASGPCDWSTQCSPTGQSDYQYMCGCIANECVTERNPWC